MVDRCFPGCHEPGVDYVAIAGKLGLATDRASAFSRHSAKASYQRATDVKEFLDDGLVPLQSALHKGARDCIQNDTTHGGVIGDIWVCVY